jgi:phosphatidylglycerophosphate synthase
VPYITKKGEVDAFRIGADALPIVRVAGGEVIRRQLANNMRNPVDRNWWFTAEVLTFASTDFFDGKLARRSLSGPSKFGGFLDQISDKYFFLRPTAQLVKNGELNRAHFWIPATRDVGATALRLMGVEGNKKTDARDLGKYKMWAQMLALGAACSPVAHENPDLVNNLYKVATGFSALSGADLAYNLTIAKQVVDASLAAATNVIELEGFKPAKVAEAFVYNAADQLAA